MSNSQHAPATFAAIANRLADLYKGQRGIQIELSHQESDLAARILVIVPEGGWPGKNEAERKIAKEIAVAEDATCKVIGQRITELRDDLADTEGEIDALREQRDALRWQATAKLADALEAKYVGRKQIAQVEAIEEALDVTEFDRYDKSLPRNADELEEIEAGLLPEEELPF